MNKEEVLNKHGWFIECHSPYELRHEDGSFASGQAADMVCDSVLENDIIEEYEKIMEMADRIKIYKEIVNRD